MGKSQTSCKKILYCHLITDHIVIRIFKKRPWPFLASWLKKIKSKILTFILKFRMQLYWSPALVTCVLTIDSLHQWISLVASLSWHLQKSVTRDDETTFIFLIINGPCLLHWNSAFISKSTQQWLDCTLSPYSFLLLHLFNLISWSS